MKLAVDKLKDLPVILEENIPAKNWDLDSFDIHFLGEIELNCSFYKIDKQIKVEAKTKTHRLIVCSRCLEEVEQDIEQIFTFYYEIEKLGEYLEVDENIREEILLTFPMKVLCKTDCKGICPGCGANLNKEPCKCKKD